MMKVAQFVACLLLSATFIAPISSSTRNISHYKRHFNTDDFHFTGLIAWSDNLIDIHLFQMKEGKIRAATSVHLPKHLVGSLPYWLNPFILSPDGREAAVILAEPFGDLRVSSGELYIVNLASKNIRSLPAATNVDYAEWSYDSRYLVGLQLFKAKSEVFDAAAGQHILSVENTYVPIWSRDSSNLIFSRFQLSTRTLNTFGAQENAKRQFWTVNLNSKAIIKISQDELGRAVGPAYLSALHISSQLSPYGVGNQFIFPTPDLLIAPYAKNAAYFSAIATPETLRVQEMGMIEVSSSLYKSRLTFTDSKGTVHQRISKDAYGGLRWTRDGNTLLGTGRKLDGSKYLFGFNVKTRKMRKLKLGHEWEKRHIMDVVEQSQ